MNRVLGKWLPGRLDRRPRVSNSPYRPRRCGGVHIMICMTRKEPGDDVSRRGNLTRRREGGPELLNPRMRRMVDLMVFGHPDDPSGTQYDIYDAAAAVGYRRKAARDLQASPLFQGAYMKALAALRNGEHAKSIKTIAEIRGDRGDNKAADRKVRLQACQALLGEGGGETDVTVNVGPAQVVTPGLCDHDRRTSRQGHRTRAQRCRIRRNA
jgi:hypothetical protein